MLSIMDLYQLARPNCWLRTFIALLISLFFSLTSVGSCIPLIFIGLEIDVVAHSDLGHIEQNAVGHLQGIFSFFFFFFKEEHVYDVSKISPALCCHAGDCRQQQLLWRIRWSFLLIFRVRRICAPSYWLRCDAAFILTNGDDIADVI